MNNLALILYYCLTRDMTLLHLHSTDPECARWPLASVLWQHDGWWRGDDITPPLYLPLPPPRPRRLARACIAPVITPPAAEDCAGLNRRFIIHEITASKRLSIDDKLKKSPRPRAAECCRRPLHDCMTCPPAAVTIWTVLHPRPRTLAIMLDNMMIGWEDGKCNVEITSTYFPLNGP